MRRSALSSIRTELSFSFRALSATLALCTSTAGEDDFGAMITCPFAAGSMQTSTG